jgi:hypothetical protein
MEIENTLSDFMFNSVSVYRCRIGNLLRGLKNEQPGVVAGKLVDVCEALLAECGQFAPADRAVLCTALFRAVFHRWYELNPGIFAGDPALPTAHKLRRLGQVAASRYGLPWALVPNWNPEVPMAELFQNDRLFGAAGQFLYGAFFESNPIDAAFQIHKCLLAIHKAALIHSKAGTFVTQIDLLEPLAFDDLFSLLFGTLMASDLPDLSALARMVCDFRPVGFVAAPLQYTQAVVEALVMHFGETEVPDLG